MTVALPVREQVLQEIQAQGRITFARFMELALFSSAGGYYTTRQRTGAEGDYFTSPEAHPLFGALLALQLEQMWDHLGRPVPFTVVEAGAGNGLLARDIVSAALRSPDFHRALRYMAVEQRPGALLSSAHALGAQKVTSAGLPLRRVVGCILSNELLDAFPVHRFVVRQGAFQEVYVTLDGEGNLESVVAEPSTPQLQQRLEGLGVRLEEGLAGEVSLQLGSWAGEAAQALERGFILTVDYGDLAHALYSRQRTQGTLRSYYLHTRSPSPYLHVGQQDMTTDVDFTTLMREGERRGLTPLGFTTQREFLLNLGLGALLEALAASGRPQQERLAHQMAMRQLVEPGGLGNHRVLVQGKGVGQPPLYGLGPDASLGHRLEAYFGKGELPPLTSEHIHLLQGTYPHMAQEIPSWEELWGSDEEAAPGQG